MINVNTMTRNLGNNKHKFCQKSSCLTQMEHIKWDLNFLDAWFWFHSCFYFFFPLLSKILVPSNNYLIFFFFFFVKSMHVDTTFTFKFIFLIVYNLKKIKSKFENLWVKIWFFLLRIQMHFRFIIGYNINRIQNI